MTLSQARKAVALAVAILVFAAAGSGSPNSERADRLKRSLMAPCCWAENVAEHNSPLASEMRAEIDRMVAAGQSDEAIVNSFKSKYGRRILTEPDGVMGVWLRAVPVIFGVAGVAAVLLVLRRWLRRPDPALRPASHS